MVNRTNWIESAKVVYHTAWLRRLRKDPFSLPPIYLEISPVGQCNHRCTICPTEVFGYVKRQLNTDILISRIEEMRVMREEDPDGLGVKSIQYARESQTLHILNTPFP